MGTSQQFSLRWNNYLRHITCAFDSLRNDENLVDVTLSCEGKKIRAHRMLLSACSTYFQDLFKENPCQHPVVIFRNVKFEDLSALVDFMYQGEVNVIQEQLSSFLATAELLAIQGLSDGNGSDRNLEQRESTLLDSQSSAESEAQLSNNSHTPRHVQTAGLLSDVSSPVSFFPVDQTCDSPPSVKRRRTGNSGGSNATNTGSSTSAMQKDTDTPARERRRIPSLSKAVVEANDEPVEIIPVMPSLKVEMPDYDEDDPDVSSCSFDDSSQGAGPGGTLSSMARLLPHGSASTSNAKQEPPDIYNTNSRDESESVSASDISQMLAKPGSSGENQSQESLQGDGSSSFGSLWTAIDPSSQVKAEYQDGFYMCKVCGKSFRRQNSLYDHMAYHQGTSKCTICNCVYSRKGNMKRHMRDVHGITDYK